MMAITPTTLLWIMLVLAAASASAIVRAQPDPMPSAAELDRLCANADCRRDSVVQIRLDDGRIQEETAALYRPPITRESVSVLLGERIEMVPEFRGQDFQGWREVRRRDGSRIATLTVSLSQESDGSISAGIGNSGRDPIKLEMYTRAPGSTLFEYTSTCPIIPGGTIFEYWNQPVTELQVRRATLITDDAALMCN